MMTFILLAYLAIPPKLQRSEICLSPNNHPAPGLVLTDDPSCKLGMRWKIQRRME